MKDDNARRLRANRIWLTADSCDLDAFRQVVERSVNRADYPFAHDVVSNVLIYDGLETRAAGASPESRKELMAEWVEALTDGPGIIVIRGAFADLTAIDKANPHFWAIIDEERLSNGGGGDHFAKPGANDRIWNALEKLCLRDPEVFAAYYAMRSSRSRAKRGSARLIRSPRSSTSSIRAVRLRSPTATIISVSSRQRRSSAFPSTSSVSRRC